MIQINYKPKTSKIWFSGTYKKDDKSYSFVIVVMKIYNKYSIKEINWIDDYQSPDILEVEDEIKKDFNKDINKI